MFIKSNKLVNQLVSRKLTKFIYYVKPGKTVQYEENMPMKHYRIFFDSFQEYSLPPPALLKIICNQLKFFGITEQLFLFNSLMTSVLAIYIYICCLCVEKKSNEELIVKMKTFI